MLDFQSKRDECICAMESVLETQSRACQSESLRSPKPRPLLTEERGSKVRPRCTGVWPTFGVQTSRVVCFVLEASQINMSRDVCNPGVWANLRGARAVSGAGRTAHGFRAASGRSQMRAARGLKRRKAHHLLRWPRRTAAALRCRRCRRGAHVQVYMRWPCQQRVWTH